MYPFQFRLLRIKSFDVIRVQGVAVYLTAYPATHPDYVSKAQEKQFYCQYRDELLIFETTGYTKFINPFHLQALYAAIKWYGRTKLSIANLEIRLTDPRRVNQYKQMD
jgi:calcineurin-like phosphoesterase family protein